MSIKKLTAGAGYDYLTRQVARHDATEVGHAGLASYYTDRGEIPGVWVGSGLSGLVGLAPGDPVTATHMQRLFGSGLHPLSDEELGSLLRSAPDTPLEGLLREHRLGRAYPVFARDIGQIRLEVARRIEAMNRAAGLPVDAPVDLEVRARIRTEVAREIFVKEQGREPLYERELAGVIARYSRPSSTPGGCFIECVRVRSLTEV